MEPIYSTDLLSWAAKIGTTTGRERAVAVIDFARVCLTKVPSVLPRLQSTIATGRIPTLQPEVQKEPALALDGGLDGLDLVRRLLAQAEDKLNDHGIILLELDPEQVPVVQDLALKHFPEGATSVEQDLARMDRILAIHRQQPE